MRAIDYLDKAAEAYPDRVALIDGNRRLTYRELQTASERAARAMWVSGLGDEDRVAIFSPNDARVLVCMLALMRAGGAWVPINYRNAADANVEYMNYAEVRWFFYHSSFSEQANELRRRVPSLRHLVCIDAEANGDLSLDQLMEKGIGAAEKEWADPRGNPDRLVGLIPTGGTTGPAKGVRVTSESWGAYTDMA